MNSKEFQHVVRHLRQVGVDTQTCEVKESADKLPSSLAETLSAFANSSRGGTIILGLSEKNGFLPVEKFSTARMQDALVSVGEKLTPVVRPEIEIFPLDGTNVLAARYCLCPEKISPAISREKECTGAPISAPEMAIAALPDMKQTGLSKPVISLVGIPD